MPPPLAGAFAVNVSMVYDLPGVRVPTKQLDGMGDNNLLICMQSVRRHHCFGGHTKDKLHTGAPHFRVPKNGRERKKIPDHST